MGASNNKPAKNSHPARRRKYTAKIPWRKRNETAVTDLTNSQHGMYEDQARGSNFQDDSYNATSFWGNQQYYNEQSNNYVPPEGYSQVDNTKYDQERFFPNCSSVEHVNDADQSYSNLSYDGPDAGHSSFSNVQFNGEYCSRSDTLNYNYGVTQRIKPLIRRRHSLNNDFERPQFSQFYQNKKAFRVQTYSLNNVNDNTYYDGAYQNNNGFGVQSYSLNNLNDRMYYDHNTFQNRNSYSDHWGSTQRISARTMRSNSANGITEVGKAVCEGKKRNSLDEDFYGEDFSSSTLPDHYWKQGKGSASNIDVSYVGPKVKRRQPYESFEENYSERSDSALSSRNNTPTGNNYSTDFTHDNWDIQSCQSEEQSNTLNILQFPSEWSCSLTSTGFVDVQPTSLEGEKLQRYFHKTSKTRDFQLHILGITRIENPFLHTLFLLKKEEMKLRNGHVDELHLYHGTKQICIPQICENNLNWRMFSEKHKFGQGVSFSPLATYSSHYCDNTDIKVMLLFKVLVSNAVVGSSSMDIPPIIEGVVYDTSIKEDISVIVKYSDNEFYPLYKIMFTKLRS